MQVIIQFTIDVPEDESPVKASEQALALLYTRGARAHITTFDPAKIPFRYQADYPGFKEK